MTDPSWKDSKPLYLVVGVVIGLVVGILLGIVVEPTLSGSASTPGASSALSVHSHAWAVDSGPTTTSSPISVLAGGAVYVFVGYVNGEIGGGSITSITDTAGDNYTLVVSTGFAQNHTEALYVAEPVQEATTLSVSVTFSGGATTMGGSVAVVDVAGSGTPFVDGVYTQSGDGASASVSVQTNHSGDLLLLGVSGQQKDSPFAPATGETLLDTADNTSGPFEDGMGFGTFSASEVGTSAVLSATLAHSAVWNAVGAGIYSGTHSSVDSAGSMKAPGLGIEAPSVAVATTRPQ